MARAYEKRNDSYSVDISTITIDGYRNALKVTRLLPGRRLLLDDVDGRFDRLKRAGVRDLAELFDRLSSRNGMRALQEATGIDGEYLVVLRREIGGLLPKPVALAALPGIAAPYLGALASAHVTDTRHMLDAGLTSEGRKDLHIRTAVPFRVIEELVRMSDLIRVNGVGPAFARTLLDAGAGSVHKISVADPDELLAAVNEAMGRQGEIKARLAVGDVEHCIRHARQLPLVLDLDR
jgi:hypothetical protein